MVDQVQILGCHDVFASPLPIHLLPVIPPSLALLYAASVQVFLSVWHECRWTSMVCPILGRAVLVGAAAAASSSVGTVRRSFDKGGPWGSPLSIAGTVASAVASAVLMFRTRRIHVQGPRPKLSAKSMSGRVVLITGANAGIGYETARQLFDAGATVVMGCRSEERAKAAMKQIIVCRSGALADTERRLRFLKVDISDLSSVRSAANAFHEMQLPLHVLVNNAGIMMGERRTSADGFELTMASNYLGHYLLTNLLLPLLRKEKDARVINLTSSTYALARSGIDLDDLNCERKHYTMFSQYAQSKLANILFNRELARREQKPSTASSPQQQSESKKGQSIPNVSCYAVHPGLVRTDVVKNMPWYLRYPNVMFGLVLALLQKTPKEGAYTSVWCASSDEVRHESGRYYVNSSAVPIEDFANDEEDAAKLWELSKRMVGLQ